MARTAKKIGADMTRSFRQVLRCEKDLQLAHAESDWDKAWKIAVELKRAIARSELLVRDFLKAVRILGLEAGNPGSQDDTDGG